MVNRKDTRLVHNVDTFGWKPCIAPSRAECQESALSMDTWLEHILRSCEEPGCELAEDGEEKIDLDRSVCR